MHEVAFDTAKTVLVPIDLYDEGAGKDYLRFNGMAIAADEVAVASSPHDGIVAVMAVRADEWNEHKDRCERGEAVVTSPLLRAATERVRGRSVNIVLTDQNVYLAVWDGDLKMAEAMPDNSTDSILYYMQVVGRRFNLKKFDIRVSGPRTGLVADALRHYYKKVRITDK
jgi:hypothetical protein